MRRAVILPDGRLDLGDQAQAAGFTPGQVVDVTVSRAGGLLLIELTTDLPIDLDVQRLPSGPARAALTRGRAS